MVLAQAVTIADYRFLQSASRARQHTILDGSPAVFKTVCSRPQTSVHVRFRPGTSTASANDSQRQPTGGSVM
jgi:hypothetical protein